MASNGESNIEHLVQAVDMMEPTVALRKLATIVLLQHERIRTLEQEIFDRCMDLRQRVANIEQSNGRHA